MHTKISTASLVSLLALCGFATVAACGGSSDESEEAPPSGQAGAGAAGASGASGSTSKGGSAGIAGAGGASGAAGKAGGSGAAGAAGNGGSAGKAGAAGTAGAAGGAGKAGAAGSSACTGDAECVAALGATVPSDCATAKCDTKTKACVYAAVDKDGDGAATSKCVSKNGVPILLGADCDDTDKTVGPGQWDGPAGDGHPNRCGDGIDQDCSGSADDGKLKDGTTCNCSPGDVQDCAQDAGGAPITFPKLDNAGKPLGKCKIGKKTCQADGKWTACIGAVGPDPYEICNGKVDDDCDGKADMDDDTPPVGMITWTYDGDGDNFADAKNPGAKQSSCPDAPPKTCPDGTTSCDPTKWKTVALPTKDCDDADPNAFPGAPEYCNDKDDDCNGSVDDTYAVDAKTWYYDYDDDGYGDINVPPVKSCKPPADPPKACVDSLANAPADYCTGVPQEGNPPTCPPDPCTADKWKTSIPNTDCRDNPGAGVSGSVMKGNKPSVVNPGATDLCNGRDYKCDGTAGVGCGCSPVGNSEACGDAATCNAGTRSCQNGGVWSACSGGPEKARVDYCQDNDQDSYCTFSTCVTNVCPGEIPSDGKKYKERTTCIGFGSPSTSNDCNDGSAAINPVAIDACDGIDNNCAGGVDEGFPTKGQGCTNGLKGSCAKSGSLVCNPSGTALDCNAGTWSDVPSQTYTATPIHGSYDVNCDGIRSVETPIFTGAKAYVKPNGYACAGNVDAGPWCKSYAPAMSINFFHWLCSPVTKAGTDDVHPSLTASSLGTVQVPTCASTYLIVTCNCMNDGSCVGGTQAMTANCK